MRSNAKEIKVSKSVTVDRLKKSLKKQLYSITEKDVDGEKLIVARKFKWGALGHLLTHISLLVIVIGTLL